jgi:SAM-dependent methyltransferase
MKCDPTTRFSNRVDDYVKYRPHYPPAVVELLKSECGLTVNSVIADIGSGPGNLTELFLKNGNRVYGVEPNREMREAGERLLRKYHNFVSIDGRAEQTTLEDASIDFVTAGQAFHWFDADGARAEFGRILKPYGWVVVAWNDRRTEGTPFLKDYEALLLKYGTDYREVSGRYLVETLIDPFFETREVRSATFPNSQVFNYAGLEGRLRSASYAPEPGHTNFLPMMSELKKLFEKHQTNGEIEIGYVTKVFYGRLE